MNNETTPNADAVVAPLSAYEHDRLATLFANGATIAGRDNILPPPSPYAFRLLSLDREADSIPRDLAEIIQSDSILAARVLGVANSALYTRGGKPLYDAKSAVLRLGVNLAFEVSEAQLIGKWFKEDAPKIDHDLLQGLWFEYLVTGFFGREIATVLDDAVVDPMLVYAGGMLHDVGTLVLCGAEPALMARFIRNDYARGTPLNPAFVQAHTRIGSAMLHRWGAPKELVHCAQRHHATLDADEPKSTLIVFIADHLHDLLLADERVTLALPGGYKPGCAGPITPEVGAAMQTLGIEDQFDAILDKVVKASSRLEDLLSGAD